MEKRLLVTALVIGCCLFATSALATTFDFIAMADGTHASYNPGEKGFSNDNSDPLSVTLDGINLTATGDHLYYNSHSANEDLSSSLNYTTTGPFHEAFAYLDSGSAGLGVAKHLTSNNQATPSSDDNLTNGEVLTLTFDQVVTISGISFQNANHGDSFAAGSDFGYIIDNQTALRDGSQYTFDGLSLNYSTPLTGQIFSFVVADWVSGIWSSDPDELYIAAVEVASVPEPATMLLLATGLAGIAGIRRRKKL